MYLVYYTSTSLSGSVTGDIDAKHNVDAIYLDFAKAFDKVPPKRFISKLKAHGIDGLLCN